MARLTEVFARLLQPIGNSLGVPGDDREKPERPILSDYAIFKKLDEEEALELIEEKLSKASKNVLVLDTVIEMNRLAQKLRERDSLHQLTDEYRELLHNQALSTVHTLLSKLGKRDLLPYDYDLKTEGENTSLTSRGVFLIERANPLQVPKVEGVAKISHSLHSTSLNGRIAEHIGESHIFSYDNGSTHFSTNIYCDFKTRNLKVAVTRVPSKT
jgi:hypothetical protein